MIFINYARIAQAVFTEKFCDENGYDNDIRKALRGFESNIVNSDEKSNIHQANVEVLLQLDKQIQENKKNKLKIDKLASLDNNLESTRDVNSARDVKCAIIGAGSGLMVSGAFFAVAVPGVGTALGCGVILTGFIVGSIGALQCGSPPSNTFKIDELNKTINSIFKPQKPQSKVK